MRNFQIHGFIFCRIASKRRLKIILLAFQLCNLVLLAQSANVTVVCVFIMIDLIPWTSSEANSYS